MLDLQALADLFAEVVRCAKCSECDVPRLLRDHSFNVPQPGYVGGRYENSRVLFVGQNPGISRKKFHNQDREYADALCVLARHPTPETYGSVCAILEGIMNSWPVNMKHLPLVECSLCLEDIAYLNVVRCRTESDSKPSSLMIENCVSGHLGRWLDLLEPRVVVFLGKWAHDQSSALAVERHIPHPYINRCRSLSSAERDRNRAKVVEIVNAALGKPGSVSKARSNVHCTCPDERPAPQPDLQKGQMDFDTYCNIFRKLGFTQVVRGKRLKHAKLTCSIYFNKRRDGMVYFTGYRKNAHLYADAKNWAHLPPQQEKDKDERSVGWANGPRIFGSL